MAKLQEIQPYVRRIATAGYYQQLAEGELCLAIGYSGDAMVARRMVNESHGNIKIDYSFAREMVPFYIDNMVIPADSPNPAAALAFINFVMRPEISASVTRFIGFATANAAALPLLEPAVRGNTIIYPPPRVRSRLELQRVYTPEETRCVHPRLAAVQVGTLTLSREVRVIRMAAGAVIPRATSCRAMRRAVRRGRVHPRAGDTHRRECAPSSATRSTACARLRAPAGANRRTPSPAARILS